MGPVIWRELEHSIQDAQERKQSNAIISLTCLKNLRRELRSYHRQDGILGYMMDGTTGITPGRAAILAMDLYKDEHDVPSDAEFHAKHVMGTDTISVSVTYKNCTCIEKYSFAQIESKFKVQIVC